MINNQKAQYIINNIPACMISELCDITNSKLLIQNGKILLATEQEIAYNDFKQKLRKDALLGHIEVNYLFNQRNKIQ